MTRMMMMRIGDRSEAKSEKSIRWKKKCRGADGKCARGARFLFWLDHIHYYFTLFLHWSDHSFNQSHSSHLISSRPITIIILIIITSNNLNRGKSLLWTVYRTLDFVPQTATVWDCGSSRKRIIIFHLSLVSLMIFAVSLARLLLPLLLLIIPNYNALKMPTLNESVVYRLIQKV